MDKINLIIADEDPNYLELFASYIRSSEQKNSYCIKSFSRADTLRKFLENLPYQILLATAKMLSGFNKKDTSNCIVLLSDPEEDNKYPEVLLKNYPVIDKFQPLNQLISQLLSIYIPYSGKEFKKPGNKLKTQVWSIYSVSGFSGKTTMALNLAKQLSFQEWQVFYLNLETYSSVISFVSEIESNEFAEILYYLKSNKNMLPSRMEGIRNRNPSCKFDYFIPLKNTKEILEITKEDVKKLIQFLVSLATYDLIIVDLDSIIHERVYGSLEESDIILWILLDEIQCLHKTNRFLLDWSERNRDEYDLVRGKTIYVVNRFTGNLSDYIKSYREFVITGYLPYISQWKYLQQSDQIFSSSLYNEQLIMLGTNILGKRAGD